MRFRIAFVLDKALEVARSIVDDLDADRVPASLRPVVAHAGDLTPPLADKLAREIDRLDWLREQALDAWRDADMDGPHRASALFLARPDGWARELIKIAWEAGAASGSGAAEREGRAARSLERDLAAARDKAKSLQKEIDRLRASEATARKEARAPSRERQAATSRSAQSLAKERERFEEAIAARDTEIERLATEVADLREELRTVRRGRAEAEAAVAELSAGGGWSAREPIELARHLDALMTQTQRTAPMPTDSPESLESPTLPAGVRPDAAEAVDAVLQMRGPIGVIVDGYNAGLALGEGAPADVRSRLEDVLRRLDTIGGQATTVTVVWDSGFEETVPRRPDALDVRFAPPGTPADDVVVAIAAAGDRSIVITNDREVRERAEVRGALALWSDALVAWARRR